jgi:hypothetical protein
VGDSTARAPGDPDPASLKRGLGFLAFALLALVIVGVAIAAWLSRSVPGLPAPQP